MNFDFSDDQKMLKDQARKFLTEKCPTKVVRKILESSEPYDKALWKELGAMGWIGAAIPEATASAFSAAVVQILQIIERAICQCFTNCHTAAVYLS